jgi:shikimate dehydrogenase
MADVFIKGDTRLCAVLGNPIEHSISPEIHNTLSRLLKINTAYVPFKVDKGHLRDVVECLKKLRFKGINVTIPYKQEIMELTDDNTRDSVIVGAVNTLKNSSGRLYGYNTDGEGFSRSFKEETGCEFQGKKILILGAGGASRSISLKAAQEKAELIYIYNRTIEKAEKITEIINNYTSSKGEVCNKEQKGRIFEQCDIIINTTSLGMYPETRNSPLTEDMVFRKSQVAYDVIYNPSETVFLKTAREKGCKAVNGFGMLLYQAVYAYEIWNGIKVPADVVKKLDNALRDYLQ